MKIHGCHIAVLLAALTAVACTQQPAVPAAVPPASTTPAASSPPVSTVTSSPAASPTPSALSLYGKAVDRSAEHEELADGEDCESPWAKAGDPVLLEPGGVEAELAAGEIDGGTCAFTFNLGQVVEHDSYVITVGQQEPVRIKPPPGPAAMITIELVASWHWTKAERAYLKSTGVDPDSAEAGDQVSAGHAYCSGMKHDRGDTLIAYLIEETSEGSDERLAAKLLCGRAKEVRAAGRGFADGSHTVGHGKDLEPGTYETLPKIRDCYWERVDDRGNIRSNEFVSFAPEGVEVTLLETGGGFVTRGCGAWIRR